VSLGTANVTDGVGAIPSAVFTTAGTRTLQAVWSGDPNYAPETSANVTVIVTTAIGSPDPGQGSSGNAGGTSSPSGGAAPGTSAQSTATTTQLANTGSDTYPWLIASIALLSAGIITSAGVRRRRGTKSH
jgi:LPXTG-motif cell wall-anchored protein